jgi:hypothetical protein
MRKTAVRSTVAVVVLGLALAFASSPAASEVRPGDDESGCPAGQDPAGALPCVQFFLGCPTHGMDVALANAAAAGASAQFRITGPGGVQDFTVSPNETIFPNVPIEEDATVQLRIEELTTGQVFLDESRTLDCTDPSATVNDVNCTTGVVPVDLANPGGATGGSPVDFTIDVHLDGESSPSRTLTVQAVDEPTSTNVTVTDDGYVQLRVHATTSNGVGTPTVETVADRSQLVDCNPPTITITAPADDATYRRGQAVTVDYACIDGGSGTALCDGTSPDDSPLDTSTLGEHSFTVNSKDFGEHDTSLTVEYEIVPTVCQGRDVTVDLRLGETPTAGDDVIVGTPGADTIRALGGDDVVCGWGGGDVVEGGGGRDLIRGGNGDDRLTAGPVGGLLAGQQGADRLNGGRNADTLRGGVGPDILRGGAAPDTGDGGPDEDQCYLFPGRDRYVDCEIIALP